MDDVVNWLITWFSTKGVVPGDSQEEQMQVNYFDASLIDSFGVVELIADIEDEFHIQFDEEHFQQRRFMTIGGLAQIIHELQE